MPSKARWSKTKIRAYSHRIPDVLIPVPPGPFPGLCQQSDLPGAMTTDWNSPLSAVPTAASQPLSTASAIRKDWLTVPVAPVKPGLSIFFPLMIKVSCAWANLPGYGYARRSRAEATTMETGTYSLHPRKKIPSGGIVLVMDIRHPFTHLDKLMLQLAASRECALHILLNKSDKISSSRTGQALRDSRHSLKHLATQATLSSFSAKNNKGYDDFRKILQDWLNGSFQSRINHGEHHNRRNKALRLKPLSAISLPKDYR